MTMPESPWTIYDYEVEMFLQLRDATSMGANKIFQQVILNAIVESMLLHLRVLTEILISKDSSSDHDNIKLTDLLPKFESRLVNDLRMEYGTRKTEGSPCWTLNKMLAHPSLRRSSSYDYSQVLNSLVPCILPLLEGIDHARELSTRTTNIRP
jgi:hypothetical protein